MKILVVDDFVSNVSILRATLAKSGHSVVTARDGLEASAALEKEPFDIVMTDWIMPNRSGYELVKWIRTNIRPLPSIVMITALGSAEARAQGLEAGVDAFITKPISTQQIQEIVINIEHNRGQNVNREMLYGLRVGMTREAEFPGIAVCAGTGGVPSLLAVFRNIVPDSSAAFFVVLQGPGWAVDAFAERLQGDTKLEVAIPGHGDRVRPGVVYLAPGGKHMTVVPSGPSIALLDTPPENYLKPSADPLMRSIAESFGSKGVSVVLGGTGVDGAIGCGYVKVARGLVIVQEPSEALSPQMPQNVITLGLAEKVLKLSEIGMELNTRVRGKSTAFSTRKPM